MSKIIDENILWKAAEKLRDKCDPADYKNVVLGLVFLKYVSDKFMAKYNVLKTFNDGRENDDDYYISEHVFIVPKESLWSEIAKHSKSEDLGQVIDNAFVQLERKNNQLRGILPKTYSKSDLDKIALGELVDFFENNLNMENADGDFFGQVYEYYIGAFAKYIPTKGGEFFTPKSVVEMMVEILEPYKGRVYDPCCGSGGMFVQCSKFVKEHRGNVDNIAIFGQESNPGTWKMAKMNLAIRGLEGNLGEKNGDSFTEDMHKNLRADYILANPPYNLKEFWKPSLEGDPRWCFGKPDIKNANYAWLSLMYSKLSPNGKAAVLMPNGATGSSVQDDIKIRKKMIEDGKVDCIISLPNKLFSNVAISVQCWILNKAKTDKNILFINASNLGKLISKKLRILEEHEIERIVTAYRSYKNGEIISEVGFSMVADYETIKKNDFVLNPGRYIEIGSGPEDPRTFDEKMNELITTLSKSINKSYDLDKELKEVLEAIGYEI